MDTEEARSLRGTRRYFMQSAKTAIRDVYDAIVELATNADDRYQKLKKDGAIEIEVERHRRGDPSILRVRDFADGMDSETMKTKLSWFGGRVSGIDKGELVRGTHSRGAKDVAALGRVVFESIAVDHLYHKFEITPFFEFKAHKSKKVGLKLRDQIGIQKGTGTRVTIELDNNHPIPQHDNLKSQLCRLVSLRGILQNEKRKVILRDLKKGREDVLRAPAVSGRVRLKESFQIPGYPDARAKLIIMRAKKRFDAESYKFRRGGVLVESRHAIHEATLFDSSLESSPHALWFYGKLKCPFIDDLCNEFDDRFEARQKAGEQNPIPLIDPSRRSGLTREHPFARALFSEALKRLRPLVDEERRREENERSSIESEATRKRLNLLEKAAVEFLKDFGDEEEPARDPNSQSSESRFRERGYALSPPFTQMVVGHSKQFWLSIHQETFPEIEANSTVQIECLTSDIVSDNRFCCLEPHPSRENVLRAIWKVKGLKPTSATGLRVRVGPIVAESDIEVLGSEADRYSNVTDLCFSNKRYSMHTEQRRKKLRILAPLDLVPSAMPVQVSCNSRHFKVSGDFTIKPVKSLGVSICDFFVESDNNEARTVITATLGAVNASATLVSARPLGADLRFKLEDIDLGNQRYRWRQNVLEIAARHPSLKRYLGDKQQGFPGQESKHFRLLLAEVVSDAVCALTVRRNVQANPEEFEDADWDQYYAIYSKYMTQFLPKAHQSQCSEGY